MQIITRINMGLSRISFTVAPLLRTRAFISSTLTSPTAVLGCGTFTFLTFDTLTLSFRAVYSQRSLAGQLDTVKPAFRCRSVGELLLYPNLPKI